MQQKKFLFNFGQTLICIGLLYLYTYHVRTAFETRNKITGLSQLEREALFRGEDALYYSFYKTMIEAPDFLNGFMKLRNLTGIEYPQAINVIYTFHAFPELIIGGLYHLLRSTSARELLSTLGCWQPDELLSLFGHVYCESQPMQFYLECVWFLGGLTFVMVYRHAMRLNGNMISGLYAAGSYMIFHSYVSKIYERPASRENFAFPIIFLQMFYLSCSIDNICRRKYTSYSFPMMSLCTALALLCWPFSAIIFSTQIIILMIPWTLNLMPNYLIDIFCNEYAATQLFATWLAFYCSGNSRYMISCQLGPTIGLIFITLVRCLCYTKSDLKRNQEGKRFVSYHLAFTSILQILSIGALVSVFSPSTILNLLEIDGFIRSIENTYWIYSDLLMHWIFQKRLSFTTKMIACKPELNGMKLFEVWELVKTCMLTPYYMYVCLILFELVQRRKTNKIQNTSRQNTIERAKNYVLEDFLEEHRVTMNDIVNNRNEMLLDQYLELLKNCNYDYELFKREKLKLIKENRNEQINFMNDIKKLKEQININKQKCTLDVIKCDTDETIADDDQSKEDNTVIISDSNRLIDSDKNKKNVINDRNEKNEKSANILQPIADNSPESNESTISRNSETISNKTELKYLFSTYVNDYCNYSLRYNLLQLTIFTVFGLNIRRLFFLCYTQYCVVSSIIHTALIHHKTKNRIWLIYLYVFIASIIHPGLTNLHLEQTLLNDDANMINIELNSMIEWININTKLDAVFAGPIDIIGTVHLTTRRPIVNHANFDMPQNNYRTEVVYGAYSRDESSDIFSKCEQLKIQYLIVYLNECTNEIKNHCDLLSIWDGIHENNNGSPQFCSEVIVKNIPSFFKVYSNKRYAIIKIFTHSVQISLKNNKLPEKIM